MFLHHISIFSLFTLSASLTGLAQVKNMAAMEEIVETHCHECHGGGIERGGLDLEAISGEALTEHRAIWEKVILRMHSRQMPPPDEDRPDEAEYKASVSFLSEYLDQTAPVRAGRVPAVRRMTRHEYRNAIRDLLSLDIEVTELLPKDDENRKKWTPLLIVQGFRPGNFRPIQYTEDALVEVMRRHGVEPTPSPPPPGLDQP